MTAISLEQSLARAAVEDPVDPKQLALPSPEHHSLPSVVGVPIVNGCHITFGVIAHAYGDQTRDSVPDPVARCPSPKVSRPKAELASLHGLRH